MSEPGDGDRRRVAPLRAQVSIAPAAHPVAVAAEPEDATARWALIAVVSFVFIIAAVVLEVVTGSAANSPFPRWAERGAPIAWPQPARVAWWLGVAGAALAFRVALQRLGFRQRKVVVLLSVGPFVVFAAGIAIGADWATWH